MNDNPVDSTVIEFRRRDSLSLLCMYRESATISPNKLFRRVFKIIYATCASSRKNGTLLALTGILQPFTSFV